MKSTRWIHICGLVTLMLLGGACSNRQQQVDDRLAENDIATTTLHTDVQTLEQRVQTVEGRLTALISDVENLEVKTRKGGKTQYVIAPAVRATAYVPLEATVTPIAPVVSAASVTPAVTPAAPPVAPVSPVQGSAPPATIPTGVALSLPPTVAPSPVQTAPLPGAQSAQTAAPVASASTAAVTPPPAQPAASLALPPEAPTVVFGQPAAASAAAPVPAPTPATAVTQSPATAAAPVSRSPLAPKVKGEENAYNAALALARGGQTAEAIKRFTTFLQDYPTGRYAPNAYYWMGECLYAQRNYTDALLQFKDVATRYPRHHKTADALLKAGMTYDRLGDKENAALQYKALMADFPNSDAARRVKGRGVAR